MSLGIFKDGNLLKAWHAYYDDKVGDLYRTLVGYTDQARLDYNRYAEYDQEQQFRFVEETCRDVKFGMGKFESGVAPVDGYNDKKIPFCYTMSKGFKLDDIAHRLYFNLGKDRIAFARALTYVCVDRNIPFYFKWSKDGARADNMVVYIEEGGLADMCQAIADVAELNPQITQVDRELPMSAEDCKWFGYGVEYGDRYQSFSRKVTNAVTRAFDDICDAYNNDRNDIDAVIADPKLIEQFTSYMKQMVYRRFKIDGVPVSLDEQLPSELRNLANLKDVYKNQTQTKKNKDRKTFKNVLLNFFAGKKVRNTMDNVKNDTSQEAQKNI